MQVEGVYVGQPGILGYRRDQPVLSAITKALVTAPELTLTELNLDGDRQAASRPRRAVSARTSP